MTDLLAKHGITYSDADHRYERFGQRITSVTGCLPYVENEWLAANQQVKEKAGDRGHKIAQDIERCERQNRKPAYVTVLDSEDSAGWMTGYWRFKQETGFRTLVSPTGRHAVEMFVYHDLMDYVGRFDILGVCENLSKEIILIDVKASALIPKTVGMQTAAYLEAYNRCAKDYELPKAKKRACLHLNPKLYRSGWKLEPLENPRDFGNFMSLLNAQRIAKDMGCSLKFVPFDNRNDNQTVKPSEVFA